MDIELFSQIVRNYVDNINNSYIILGKYFYHIAKTKGINRVPEEEQELINSYIQDIKELYAKVQTENRLDDEARDFIYMLTSR